MANPRIDWNLTSWFHQTGRLKTGARMAATDFTRKKAKKLGQALAYHTPLAPYRTRGSITVNRGRARAGWWPAALTLGMRSVYTKAPNRGEGYIIDGSSARNPKITLANTVPYILKIVKHGDWPRRALTQESVRAKQELEQSYKLHMKSAI